MLHNYIHENNFWPFFTHENIFTTKKVNYSRLTNFNLLLPFLPPYQQQYVQVVQLKFFIFKSQWF